MKCIPRCVGVLVLLILVGIRSSYAEEVAKNNHFASLKAFLDTRYDEFDVKFSILHHSNSYVEKTFEKFVAVKFPNSSLIFDKPIFYDARVTRDGFSLISGNSLANIENGIISPADGSAFGVVSNQYWSVANKTIFYDANKYANMTESLGPHWTEFQYATASKMMSLCLPIEKGTVKWVGTNFIAKRDPLLPRPHSQDPSQDMITGTLTLDKGKPSHISLTLDSVQESIFFQYNNLVHDDLIIPTQILVSDELPPGRGSNTFTWTLISLVTTNFPPGSTDPKVVLKSARAMTVVDESANGMAEITVLRGNPFKKPIAVKMGEKNVSLQSFRYAKFIVLALMLLSTVILAVFLIRRGLKR